jgi:hypothetical protein
VVDAESSFLMGIRISIPSRIIPGEVIFLFIQRIFDKETLYFIEMNPNVSQ